MTLDMEYLRIKLIITLLRLVSWVTDFLPRRRDRLASQQQHYYSKNTRRRILIPSRDKHRSIKADLYLPQNHKEDAPKKVLINWHGSGFIFPGFGSDALFCARVACETGIAVVDADYRKAPETPFPGAVEDVEDVLRWVHGGGGGGGGGGDDSIATQNTTRVAVSGFSSGGNLALVAASALKKKNQQKQQSEIAAVLAFYPIVDMTLAPEAKRAPRGGDDSQGSAAPPHVARMFKACYLPDPAMYTDTKASPGLADAADFPSTVAIFTCDGDKLAPEAMALADKLNLKMGRKVVGEMVHGVGHGFDKGAEKGTLEWERREEMYALAVSTLKEAFTD